MRWPARPESHPNISADIEIGRTSPSLKSLDKVATALQLPPGRLLQTPDLFSSGVIELPVLDRVVSLEPANRHFRHFRPLKMATGDIEIVGVVTNVITRV